MPIVEMNGSARARLATLFGPARPGIIIDAVLEGYMGRAWADDVEDPTVARLQLADILCFGGDAAHDLRRLIPRQYRYAVVRFLPVYRTVVTGIGKSFVREGLFDHL